MRIATLLPQLAACVVEPPVRYADHWLIRLRLRRRAQPCPACHRRSRQVHSHYTRRLADLPISGTPVFLSIAVRRFRCRNPHCPRCTFVEVLPPHLAQPRARRTEALRAALEQVGLFVGGRPGERLGGCLGLIGSRASLLRLVRHLPDPPPAAPRVLGVDEFARRKGRTYSTILVDVETHRPVDVLDDRSAASFNTWLRQRAAPPEIICRDRASCYADGARQGAPEAVQVADRYHILANLSDAVERVLMQHTHCWQDDPLRLPPPTAPAPPPVRPPRTSPLVVRQQQRFDQVQDMVARGMTITKISHLLHLDRKTVRTYARASSPAALRRERPSGRISPLLARYLPQLQHRWQEGCEDGAVLFAEIHAQGYRGSARTLRRYLLQLRQGDTPADAPLVITGREVASLVLRHPEHLSVSEHRLLDHLKERCPDLATIHTFATGLATIICQRQGATALDAWLDGATTCGVPGLATFAAGLRKDLAAVQAAVTEPWSSGVVEGTNTRIKLIKRQMYGRGGHDLLRKRILLAR